MQRQNKIGMFKLIKQFVAVFAIFIALFIVQRLIFIGYYSDVIAAEGAGDIFAALLHGLPLDMSVAGYLSAIPGLLLVIQAALGENKRWLTITRISYFGIISLLISAIFVVDLALYGFWGFRLDMTPLFYFMTSPADAVASVSGWFVAGGVLALLVASAFTFAAFYFTVIREKKVSKNNSRIVSAVVLFLFTGCLFIPIRGGFTVSTMNLSKAYFSQNQWLNHAAINPDFSLLYSATHQNNFGEQYNYFEDSEAAEIMKGLVENAQSDSIPTVLTNKRPEVIMIILESFSNHLMEVTGGENVAVNLNNIAKEGLLFNNFYANSFRTDRALTSIISAYPAQPSTSIMKYVEKAETLPSIPKTLRDNGYDIGYYYGGDANFTNMLAYLVSCKFDKIISDKDFPLSQRQSKWGANDGTLFEKFISDYKTDKQELPRFRIIQTSSSHDPFDVPYNKFENKAKNAFAYTDDCLGKLVDELKKTANWDNTLLVITADHYEAYPLLDDKQERHKVPLILYGGALAKRGIDETYSSQIDIAATLLYQMGISHSEFAFSKNILNDKAPHFAYISDPGCFGIISADNCFVYNGDADAVIIDRGAEPGKNAYKAKAFIQSLYDDLDKR